MNWIKGINEWTATHNGKDCWIVAICRGETEGGALEWGYRVFVDNVKQYGPEGEFYPSFDAAEQAAISH